MSSFASLSSAEIRAHRETVLLRILIRTAQIETNELVRRLRDLGHEAVQPSHIGLLSNIDTEGTRIAGLSRRLGVTRQAASQMVTELEKRGWVERSPDPDDRRAVLVRHTATGRRMLLDALEQMDDIERGYVATIGAEQMRLLKESLLAIADAADPDTTLGR